MKEPRTWLKRIAGAAVIGTFAFLAPAQAFSTPIDDKYAALGGTGSFLGTPTDIERPTPGNGGSYRAYEHGSIHWSQASGAHETHGLIEQKWAEMGWEQGSLGFPISDEEPRSSPPGRVSRFQHGRIEWSEQEGARVFLSPVANTLVGKVLGGTVGLKSALGVKSAAVAGRKISPTASGNIAPATGGKVAPATTGAMLLGSARLQQFRQAVIPNTPLLLVKPFGASTKVAPSTAGVQLQHGEFVVAATKAEISRTSTNTRFLLPTRALTTSETGETFDLQPTLELASPGLQISEDGTKYTAQILLGLLDAEKPNIARTLPDPVWVLLRSNAVDVKPIQVSIAHTNLPYEIAVASGDPAGDSVDIELKIPSFKSPANVRIQVLRPGVRLHGQHEAEGLGAGAITLSVSLAPGVGTAHRNVSLTAEKGDVVPQTVELAEGESKDVEYRPRLLGSDVILASTANLADAKHQVSVVFPWMFLLAAFLGGGIGSVILRLLRPNRAATVLFRYFLGGVLMGFLVACIYALGVNVTTVPIPIQRTPLSIFVLGALGAIAAIPLVSKWSEQFRGLLEGPG